MLRTHTQPRLFPPPSPSPPPFFPPPPVPTLRLPRSLLTPPQLPPLRPQPTVKRLNVQRACRGLIRIIKSLLSCLFTSCGGNYVIAVVVLAADGDPERSKHILYIIVAKILLSIKLFSLKRQNSEDILASS